MPSDMDQRVLDQRGLEPGTARPAAHRPTPPQTAIGPLGRGALNLPNAITLGRLFLAIVLFVLIDQRGMWLASAALFAFAASTDFLDGWVARKYGLITTLGRILDPFVDKIIVLGAFVFLLDKQHEPAADGVFLSSGVNPWMVVIVFGREMFITTLRAFLEQHGRDFSAAWSGKVKMTLQCAAVTASLISLAPAWGTQSWVTITRDVLLWGAILSTLQSAYAYVSRAATMLREG